MKTAYLIHFFHDDKQTLGTIVVQNKNGELWICKTLELGWHDNQQNISRIPQGDYLCTWSRSNRLSTLAGHDVFTYEVLNVPNRLGIRIHSANYFYQLMGCIALGSATKDINLDGNLDTIHSGNTVAAFAALMEYKNFELTITD